MGFKTNLDEIFNSTTIKEDDNFDKLWLLRKEKNIKFFLPSVIEDSLSLLHKAIY